MTKREMMIKAHGLAKTMVGNYSVRLSLALTQLWASLKKGVAVVAELIGTEKQIKWANQILADAKGTIQSNIKLSQERFEKFGIKHEEKMVAAYKIIDTQLEGLLLKTNKAEDIINIREQLNPSQINLIAGRLAEKA